MTRDVPPVPSPITIPDFTSATALLARASLKTSCTARVLLENYISPFKYVEKERVKDVESKLD